MKRVRVYGLSGFNRHGLSPVIEQHMALEGDERRRLESENWNPRLGALFESVTRNPLPEAPKEWRNGGDRLAERIALGALALQQATGLPVAQCGRLPPFRDGQVAFHVEFDCPDCAFQAVDLMVEMAELALAGQEPGSEAVDALRGRFDRLCEQGPRNATPADGCALIAAARRRDIPVFRMDREPYDPIEGSFRIRPNGLLRFGQGHRQRTVDGTFCVERSESLHGLVHDRSALFNRLRSIGLSPPMTAGSELRQCISPHRAAREARRTGFPVALKTVRRMGSPGVRLNLADDSEVERAAYDLLRRHDRVYVERFAPGDAVELFYVAGRYFGPVERPSDGPPVPGRREGIPGYVLRETDRIAGLFDVGCMSLTLIRERAGDGDRWWVVDVDLAPRLDRIAESQWLEPAAERFMDWLFPDDCASRIPIAAVTGTNGKTTTAFFLERILRESGITTGLACSTGSYVSGRPISQFEDGYLPGHLTVLDNREVEAAVLETTRGGALTAGIGFDRCEVAACLNVAADHLDGEMGIETVEQLARVKRWIVERGMAAVLNADDSHCLGMLENLGGRPVTLVSRERSARDLLELSGANGAACVIERIANCDWIVLHVAGERKPVAAVDAIPSTFGGRAAHNVCNAMHAAAMAQALGVDIRTMATGLMAIEPDAETLPARLNLHHIDGMDVLVDYAHNPHGLSNLVHFTDQWDVAGRRIIAVTLPADRGDDFVRQGAAEVAGHFDLYICKNYRILYGREPHEVPELLRAGLEDSGVDPGSIIRIPDEKEAVRRSLAMGRPGDLVVLVVGKDFRELSRLVGSIAGGRAREDG